MAAVASIMTSPAVVVRPDLCLRDVAQCLHQAGVGAAVVTRGGTVAGIISERDVVAAVADGADPGEIWAADVMTPDPVWADPDDSPERALDLMLTAGVRHLPVVADGDLMGVVALRDVVASALDRHRAAL